MAHRSVNKACWLFIQTSCFNRKYIDTRKKTFKTCGMLCPIDIHPVHVLWKVVFLGLNLYWTQTIPFFLNWKLCITVVFSLTYCKVSLSCSKVKNLYATHVWQQKIRFLTSIIIYESAWRNLFVPIMGFNWDPEYINRSQKMKSWNLRLAWLLDAYLVVLLTKVFEEGVKLIFVHVTVPVLERVASIVNINKQRCVTATEETQRHAT